MDNIDVEGASTQLRNMGFETHVESTAKSRFLEKCAGRAKRTRDRSLPTAARGIDAPDLMT